MTSREFNTLLLKRFPEIKGDFENYVNWQDGIDTGSFLVVEDVFNKLLWRSVENGDTELTKRVFSFAEAILNLVQRCHHVVDLVILLINDLLQRVTL